MTAPTASRRRRYAADAGMLLVFAPLFLGCWLFVDGFGSWVNMQGLALSVTTVGIVACTMMLCLAAGDFDLSVGSQVAFCGVVAATVIARSDSIAAGVLAGLLAGAAVGWVNGVVIATVGINALITTLATMQIVRGLGYIVSDGKAVGVGAEGFFRLGISKIAGVPTPVVVMIACFLVFSFVLAKTRFGRQTLATGGNLEAARLSGLPVTRIKIILFTLQGVFCGLAGILLASRMTSGQPTTAQGLELQVISACVLGGVSLTGGVATMSGVVIGVLIMGTVQNAMNLLNIPPFYQYLASGGILLAAVMLDQWRMKRARQTAIREAA